MQGGGPVNLNSRFGLSLILRANFFGQRYWRRPAKIPIKRNFRFYGKRFSDCLGECAVLSG